MAKLLHSTGLIYPPLSTPLTTTFSFHGYQRGTGYLAQPWASLLHTLLIDGKLLKGNCFSGPPVLGPLLFILYTPQPSSVIQSHNLDHHFYADDTQIYVSFPAPDTCCSLNQLRDCLQDVSLWMKNSKLKPTADKIDLFIIGTSTQQEKLDGFFPTHIPSQSNTQF